jgi:hypothetical protein
LGTSMRGDALSILDSGVLHVCIKAMPRGDGYLFHVLLSPDIKPHLTNTNHSSSVIHYYVHSVPRPGPRPTTSSISTPRPSTIPYSTQAGQARPNAFIRIVHPHAFRHLPPSSLGLQSLIADLRAGQISLGRGGRELIRRCRKRVLFGSCVLV